jgi:mRNA interferase RelE/StbE
MCPRIESVVEGLTGNPRTLHTEKLEGSPNAYRLRVGEYRILFTIDDRTHIVTVYRIRHRREAYR